MAINKKLISFATQAQFDVKLNAGDIDNRSIVFIEDKKRIWTHGVYFDTSWNYMGDKPDTYTPSAHTLGSHSDVTLAALANGDILKYDGSKWVNNTLAQAGIATPADISTAINAVEIGGRNLIVVKDILAKSTIDAEGNVIATTNNSKVSGWISVTASNYILSVTHVRGIYYPTIAYYDNDKGLIHKENFSGEFDIISLSIDDPNIKFIRVVQHTVNSTYSNPIDIWKLEKGTIATDWTPAPEDQVTDWNETNVNSFAFLKNKPTQLSQFTDNMGIGSHITNKSNPHSVTKAQVGLGNVLNVASYSKTESDGKYLPLVGGTLTGSSYNMLELKRSSVAGSSILFSNSTTSLGKIGFTSNGNLIIGTGLSTDGVADMLSITPSGIAQFYGNILTSGLVTGTGFSKTGATDAHVLLGSGGHKAISDFNASLVTSTTTSGISNVATSNTNTYLNIVQGGASIGSSTRITGSGSVTVSSDVNGVLTINGVNTTYTTGTLAQLNAGTDTTGRLQTAKLLNDWLNSKLDLKATPADISTAIDDIEIGGRNLLVCSDIKRYSNGLLLSNPGIVVNNNMINPNGYLLGFSLNFEPNKSYLLSGIANISGGTFHRLHYTTFDADNNIIDNDQYLTLSPYSANQDKYFELEFSFSNPLIVKVHIGIGRPYNDVNYYKNLKLEKGNKATDWTPAPEDQVSDWNETDVTSFSYIKNKPTQLSQFADNIGVATHIANKTNPHSVTTTQIGAVDLTTNQTIGGVKSFTGNVGIGTTAPTEKLHINGNLLVQLSDTLTTRNVVQIKDLGESGSTGARNWALRGVYQYSNGAMGNAIGGDLDLIKSLNRNTILATKTDGSALGNVGIGTTSPAYKLDVSGTGRFTDNVTAPTFVGSLSGNASSASTVTLTADNATNATRYPLFVSAATGNLSPSTDTGFTYNPSTGALTTTSFVGNLTGLASLNLPLTGGTLSGTLGVNLATSSTYNFAFQALAPTLSANQQLIFQLGKSVSTNDRVSWVYNHIADGSVSNFMSFSFYGASNHQLKIEASGASTFSGNVTAPTFIGSLNGNASSATKVNNNLTLKFDTGTTENTNLYTYDGSSAKTIDIKAGSNVSFTKTGNTVTVNSTNTTYLTGTLSELNTGTNTTGKLQTAKDLNDWINGKGYITSYIDTNSISGIRAGASTTSTNATTTNPYIKVTDDGTYREQIRLSGDGATTVTSDASGNVTISSTNTTYTTGTLAQLNAGAHTVSQLHTAKLLNDWINPKLDNKFDKTGGRLTAGIGDVNIELWRGTNASWNILNSGGYLRFQSNYTTVVGAYFDALKLDYNTGNALFKGTVIATSFVGNINASSLNTGTVPDARITGTYTGLTNLTGTGNVDFARFIGNAGDTVAAPSITWTGDLNTGIYRPAAAQVAITTGGVQRALFSSAGITGTLVGNASSATTANSANLLKSVNENTITSVPTGTMSLDRFNSASSGSMPTSNNANAALTINTHSGNYHHQLGFSSDGKMYHRAFSNEALNATKAWTGIALVSDLNEKIDADKFQVVAEMPGIPTAGVFYFVKEY